VIDWVSLCKELIEKKTSPEATKALELISNALHICPYSDSLKEMKAETLLMVCISFSFGSLPRSMNY
jgi:DnaJ homolog subfamily C member 7